MSDSNIVIFESSIQKIAKGTIIIILDINIRRQNIFHFFLFSIIAGTKAKAIINKKTNNNL